MAQLPDLKQRFLQPDYFEIGWGDVGFYEAQEITLGLALKALFNSSGSVIHLVEVPDTERKTFVQGREIKFFCVKPAEYDRLIQFLVGTFTKDPNNRLLPKSTGLYGNSQFYVAEGRYSLLHTCNNWTAKALEAAGFDISPSWYWFASSVMRKVQGQGCENVNMLPQ